MIATKLMFKRKYVLLSESTKDNIIQIQTGGTVSKEWVMSVYLLSSSVAIDPCACDKGPMFQK